jgi:capsular polysaccharide biosynthesis protein
MNMQPREVDLLEAIRILLQRRLAIGVAVILTTLVVGGYGLLLPTEYEASALAVVAPGEGSVQRGDERGVPGQEIVVAGLGAQTYSVLATGDELMKSLLDTLVGNEFSAETASTIEHMSVRSLSGLLRTELIGAAKGGSPILSFTVTSRQQDLPVTTVNHWVELFVERHRGLSEVVAEDYYDWVQAQYATAKSQLESTEDAARRIESAYSDLSILQAEISTRMTKLNGALTGFQEVETELEALRRERDHTRRQVAALEVDGTWLGYADWQTASVHSDRSVATPVRSQLLSLMPQLTQALADSLAMSAEHKARQREFRFWKERLLLDLERATGIKRVRLRVNELDARLESHRKESQELDLQIREREIELRVLEQNLAEEPKVHTVAKAISDTELWEQTDPADGVDPRVQEALGHYRLMSQELNKTHLSLADKLRSARVAQDRATERVRFFAMEIPALEQELVNVRQQLDSLGVQERERLHEIGLRESDLAVELLRARRPVVERLERKRKAVEGLRQSYREQKGRLEVLGNEIAELTIAVDYKEGSFGIWTAEVLQRRATADSLLLVKTRLGRDLEVFRGTHKRFSMLAEEARIARKQAADDVKIVARAVAARPVQRGHWIKIALAGAVALFLSSIVVLTHEYLGRARTTDVHPDVHPDA